MATRRHFVATPNRSAWDLATRLGRVLRTEGPLALAAKAGRRLGRLAFARDKYLVFTHDLRAIRIAPKVRDAELRILCEPGDLTPLAAEGLDTSCLHADRIESHLRRGGMICCIFVGGAVAHQSWVSTGLRTPIDPVAPHIDYRGCAYIGACETAPAHRGLGLYPYALSELCLRLGALGYSNAMLTVSPDNAPSIAGITKAGFRFLGEGCLLRVLGATRWRMNVRHEGCRMG